MHSGAMGEESGDGAYERRSHDKACATDTIVEPAKEAIIPPKKNRIGNFVLTEWDRREKVMD